MMLTLFVNLKMYFRKACGFSGIVAASAAIFIFSVVFPSCVYSGNSSATGTDMMISMKSVVTKIRRKEDVTLVDVRPAHLFEKARIPGSVNMPAFTLKTRQYLKQGNVILIGHGYHDPALESACEKLRSSGFEACIMAGGINAWHATHRPVHGDPFAIAELNRITAERFFIAKNGKSSVVICTDEKGHRRLTETVPSARYLNVEDAPGKAVSILRRTIRPKMRKRVAVFVLSASGSGYDRFERVLQEAGCRNLFFVTGGVEKYDVFLKKLELSGRPASRRIRTVNRCAPCAAE